MTHLRCLQAGVLMLSATGACCCYCPVMGRTLRLYCVISEAVVTLCRINKGAPTEADAPVFVQTHHV
jgi:hypothetical protein